MRDSVPILSAKIIQNRPRIVCFVGKGIWLIVEAVFKKQILEASGTQVGIQPLELSVVKEEDTSASQTVPATPIKSPRKNPHKKAVNQFNWGLQSYKFVYDGPKGECLYTVTSPRGSE